jgi:hypothetical protein
MRKHAKKKMGFEKELHFFFFVCEMQMEMSFGLDILSNKSKIVFTAIQCFAAPKQAGVENSSRTEGFASNCAGVRALIASA